MSQNIDEDRRRAREEDAFVTDAFIQGIHDHPWSGQLKHEACSVITEAIKSGKRTSSTEPATVLIGINGFFVQGKETMCMRYNALIFDGQQLFHDKVRLCDKDIPYTAATFKQLTQQPTAVYVGMVPGKQILAHGRENYLFCTPVMGHPLRVRSTNSRNPFVVINPGNSMQEAQRQIGRYATCSNVDGFGVCTILIVKGESVKDSVTAAGDKTRMISLSLGNGIRAKYSNFQKMSEATTAQVTQEPYLLFVNPTLPPSTSLSNETLSLFTSGFSGLYRSTDAPFQCAVTQSQVDDFIQRINNVPVEMEPTAATTSFDM